MGVQIQVLCSCLILITFFQVTSVNSYVRKNSEPLNIGFIFSLPYDISNTLRAPLAGPLSLVLGAGLALVMFFGILVSPISYLWGLPPRRYGIHDALKDKDLDSQIFSRLFPEDPVFLMSGNASAVNGSTDGTGNGKFVDFMTSAFSLLPEVDEQCRLLMVCHAHGFLKHLPDPVLKIYHFVSRRVTKVPSPQQQAIAIGLEDQGECAKVFSQCTFDILSIAKSTAKNLITTVVTVANDAWQDDQQDTQEL